MNGNILMERRRNHQVGFEENGAYCCLNEGRFNSVHGKIYSVNAVNNLQFTSFIKRLSSALLI